MTGYILIITMVITNSAITSGHYTNETRVGSVATAQFNSEAACERAGKLWAASRGISEYRTYQCESQR